MAGLWGERRGKRQLRVGATLNTAPRRLWSEGADASARACIACARAPRARLLEAKGTTLPAESFARSAVGRMMVGRQHEACTAERMRTCGVVS
eukprot:3924803-Pleurochrysis_carterae.AAC.1